MGKVTRIKEPSSVSIAYNERNSQFVRVGCFSKTFSKLWQTVTVIAGFANVNFRRFTLILVQVTPYLFLELEIRQ